MASSLAIRATATLLPRHRVAVADLPELAALTDAERRTCAGLGIEEIRVDDASTAFDLAAGAAERVLAETGLTGGDLDGLIVIEPRAPQRLLTSDTTRLQARLDARRAVAFSVGGLGCVSLTPALIAARGLFVDPDVRHVLVVHGSKPATPARYRHPVTVNGDGGVAVLLARSGPVRVLDIAQETDGAYWDLFDVDYRDRPVARWRESCRDVAAYSFQLAVETRNRLRDLHRRVLDRNGVRVDEVACHLGHNLSVGAFRFAEESLGVEVAEVCFENLRRHGHLGAADVLLNLSSALERGVLGEGRRAVLFNASPVAAWSVLLVEAGEAAPAHYL